MHAVYIACIYQIYIVFKEYGEDCISKEIRRKCSNFSFLLFLLISSLKREKSNFSNLCCTNCLYSFSGMGTKIKGIYKAGFKYISNIFVVKEHELEIGFPKDIKHVGHIGWEGTSGTAPTWMKEFKTGPNFATTRIGNNGSPWSTQECNKGDGEVGKKEKITLPDDQLTDIPKPKKKRKTKSRTSSSSSKSGSSSSSKSGSSSSSSRASKPKAKFVDGNNKLAIKIEATSIGIEVA